MSGEKFDVFSNKFAHDIYLQKYSMNQQEKWEDTARRVVSAVCGQLLDSKTQEKIYKLILDRKFIPGGRYLYSAGRPFHQVNNCFLFRVGDSREEWSDLMYKVTSSLMTGGGIGVDYSALRPEGAPIKGTGGFSTGPIALMKMTNEAGRHIMQGGQRRSAIYASLNWKHDDIYKFMSVKNHSSDLRAMKEKDFNFELPMELTNISVNYDTEFFIAIEDESHPLHQKAKDVFTFNCKQAFSTAEPGFSFNYLKDNETLRNACQPEFAPISLVDGKQTTFGQLEVGQVLKSGYNNQESKVIKKWSNGIRPTYIYTFDDGSVFIGTTDHKVVIETPYNTNLKMQIEEARTHGLKVKTENGYYIPRKPIFIGDHEVFEITVDNVNHTYVSGGVVTSNCTEVVSEDDSDKCNLGTLWINRFKDRKEFAEGVKYSTLFLLCGAIYSDVPNAKIKEVGDKNNRIGLGLGGIHEWLMLNGGVYACTPELHKWLRIYEQESDSAAFIYAKQLGVAIPKGKRAIAPTGTIGILAETTTGIEPLFCKAYKRRYFKDGKWMSQLVVDGSVKRLLEKGISVDKIQDSYDLSFKERVKFQADVQNYVDMSISSTCNLPPWGSPENNEDTLQKNMKILLKYAKRLRGFTCYPDGCRGGQPLTRVSLEEALKQEGVVFEENETSCVNGVCGI